MPSPPDLAGRDRAALVKHLTSYWQMEAANVLFVPAMAWFLIARFGDAPDLAFWLGAAACSGLLVIGAAAWRFALAGLQGKPDLAARLTAFCAAAELPGLVLTGVATIATAAAVVANGWPPRTIAAAVLTALAWAEYVNYYHWQLQNFDSLIDLKRLAAGRGLRRAHMGRAVRAHRRKRAAG